MKHRTRPDEAAVTFGWADIPGTDLEWVVVPVEDSTKRLSTGRPVIARLTYRDALAVAERYDARLISPDEVQLRHEMAKRGEALELVAFTGTPTAETELVHSERHDADCWRQLEALGWDGQPVANFGKHWVHGAPPGRSWLMGWWVPKLEAYGMGYGPGFVQPRPLPGSRGPHDDQHHDDGTTTILVRKRRGLSARIREVGSYIASLFSAPTKVEIMTRPTIKIGSRGEHVQAWQRTLGVEADGIFGSGTERATKAWQSDMGLVADGVVGPKSWLAAGETPEPARPVIATKDQRSPACLAALRDANERWPKRRKVSDGIMGDAAHQARPSDHNLGNAVDLTHDPASGADGEAIAQMAVTDGRVTYVIWNARIYNRARAAEGWRPYSGANPHKHHVHISVAIGARDDASPWPWAVSQS